MNVRNHEDKYSHFSDKKTWARTNKNKAQISCRTALACIHRKSSKTRDVNFMKLLNSALDGFIEM